MKQMQLEIRIVGKTKEDIMLALNDTKIRLEEMYSDVGNYIDIDKLTGAKTFVKLT